LPIFGLKTNWRMGKLVVTQIIEESVFSFFGGLFVQNPHNAIADHGQLNYWRYN